MADKTKKAENSQAATKPQKSKYFLLEDAKIDGYYRLAGWEFAKGDIPDPVLQHLLKIKWCKEA